MGVLRVRRDRPREERGAIAVVMSAVIVLLLLISAFVVDIGMQRAARRDMQAVADAVALDAARLLDSRPASKVITPGSPATKRSLADTVKDSVDRNRRTSLGSPPTTACPSDATCDRGVEVFLVTLNASGSYPKRPDGLPVSATGSTVPTGVVVIADTRVGFAFGGLTGNDSGTATRTAVARTSQPTVCFTVGTKTLTLDTSTGGLSPLLKGILGVNLNAVGYDGLANLKSTKVPIAGLLAQLNVGSTDELLSTNVSLSSFMVATANALRAQGDTASALLLEAVKLGVSGSQIALGKILALQSGTQTAGLTADVNVLDILGAAIVAANGQNAVSVNIPNVASIKVVEPPQIACGGVGVEARSAQIRVRVKTTVAVGALPVVGLLNSSSVVLDLPIDIGAGTAKLMSLGCDPLAATVSVTTGGVNAPPLGESAFLLLALKNSTFLDVLDVVPGVGFLLKATLSLLLGTLGLGSVDLKVGIGASVASTTESKVITYPASGLPGTVVVPTGGVGKALDLKTLSVDIVSTGLVGALGSLLTPVLNQLTTTVVSPIVNALSTGVLTPVVNALSSVLGLKLGVAEVSMLGRPPCSSAQLVG